MPRVITFRSGEAADFVGERRVSTCRMKNGRRLLMMRAGEINN
jgi:hypothetical protein